MGEVQDGGEGVRLGDLDALETAIDKEREILIEQGRPGAEHIVVHHARRLIEEAPTIDAIPVEWLTEKYDEEYKAIYYCKGDAKKHAEVMEAVWMVQEMWQKEQEAR